GGWGRGGRWWPWRHLGGRPPAPPADEAARPPSFAASLLIVVLPLVQSLLGFGAKLLGDVKQLPEWLTEAPVSPSELPEALGLLAHPPVAWLQFLGHPMMALLVPTGLAFWLLGLRRGMTPDKLAKVAGDALTDVGGILFRFGAAGGFKEVIQATGAGDYIAKQVMQLDVPKVLVFYLVAVLMRLALGSATAAILTASALLAAAARGLPGQETLLVLA